MKLFFETRQHRVYDDEVIYTIFPANAEKFKKDILNACIDMFNKKTRTRYFVDSVSGNFNIEMSHRIVRKVLKEDFSIFVRQRSDAPFYWGLYIENEDGSSTDIGQIRVTSRSLDGLHIYICDNHYEEIFGFMITAHDYEFANTEPDKVSFKLKDL